MEQTNIFDFLYKKYKITKPIRLIEFFAGYGSQALALKYLGVEFTHWRICEWATKSIQAYNDLHIRDYTDYSNSLTTDEVIKRLSDYGISYNYNSPMSEQQIKNKGEQWQRKTYNNIIATHNQVDISKTKAKDLSIIDTNSYTYILTYSFPCQDLSVAGKRKGMDKGKGTRSGLLWQVERLLDECIELPQILVMENVQDLLGTKNIENFKLWQYKLETLGYKNYVKVLSAKDYKIPQNRKRCFMVSVLGDYNFSFKTLSVKNNVFEFLSNDVDKKYYFNNKLIEKISELEFTKDSYLKDTIDLLTGKYKDKAILDLRYDEGLRIRKDNLCPTLTTFSIFNKTSCPILYTPDKGLRYLTAKEHWRLMGVKDNDFINVAKNQDQKSLYHLAGDSIVTTCLMAIFGELLNIDYKTKINELVADLKEKQENLVA